jgi:peptidyl-prolyl cis-trans isomerase SurA
MKSFCLILVAALVSCAPQLRAELINGIRAIVHDSVITQQDLQEAIQKDERALRADARGQEDVYRKNLAEVERNHLDQLIERQLILHEFATAGYELPEKVLDDWVQDRLRAYGDRATAIKTLEAEGTTFEKFRKRIREQYIERAMWEKNVSSSILISPHKVEAYYQEHHESYKLEDEVKLRVIVLNKSSDPDAPDPHKMAEEILGKLKEGTSFADMAKVYSQGSQRQEGGDWGWREKSYFRKELADVAFSLKAGERSDIIDTPDACYLMLVEETRPAHYQVLTEVREQIEKELQTQERTRLRKQWIDKLKKKTFVVYFR